MENNAVIDCILSRTTIRKFLDQPVETEKIQTVLKCGMAAPTSMNLQPWEFILVENLDLKLHIREVSPFAKMITAYTACVIVCGKTDIYQRINLNTGEDNTLYWVEDCSAASQNILLASHSLGLSAVWLGVYPLESRIKFIKETLSIPDNVTPLNIIVIGYPWRKNQPIDKYKPEKIHKNFY